MIERPAIIDEGGKAATILQPGMLRKESKTIAIKEHTVRSGTVTVLDVPPATPNRKWAGVAHNLGDILYLRADSVTAVHEWLAGKGFGAMVEDENKKLNFVAAGCYVDVIGDIMLEPPTYDLKDPENPVQLTSSVMAGGHHVNVRLLKGET